MVFIFKINNVIFERYMNKTIENNRIKGIDILKVIACIGVVALHSLSSEETISKIVRFSATGSIPIFYMCSGYLIINKRITKEYLIRKVYKILFFCIFWVVIYETTFLIKSFLYGVNVYSFSSFLIRIIKSFLLIFIQKGNLTILWYFCALIFIYCYSFYLNIFNEEKRTIIIITTFITSIFVEMTFQLLMYFNVLNIYHYLPNSYRVFTLFFYTQLGIVLETKKIFRKKRSALYLILFLLALCLSVTFEYYASSIISNYLISDFYTCPLVMVQILFLWLFANAIEISFDLSKITKLTLYIYPIHYLLILTVSAFVVNGFLFFLIVMILSVLISFVLSKITFFNKILAI